MNDVVHDALTNTISRVVAALTPVIASVIAAVLYWLQDAVGIDLQVDPAVAAAFVGTLILGACLTAFKWLEGRAAWERAVAAGTELHRTGTTLNRPVDPADAGHPLP
jgi:hypothetical protein